MGEPRNFLKAINHNLQLKIIKNMELLDFARFNQCSKESAEICKNLSDCVKFPLSVKRIDIDEDGKAFVILYSKYGKKCVSDFPRVRLTAESMILKAKHSSFLKQHSVKTNFVHAVIHPTSFTDANADFVKFILRTTQATKFEMNSSSEKILSIPEFQKLQELHTHGFLPLTDKTFVKLKAHTMKMEINHRTEGTTVTRNGIFEFIKQWVAGKRSIRKFHLYLRDPANAHWLCVALNTQTKAIAKLESDERIVIRRNSEDTADVLFVKSFYGIIDMFESDWRSVDAFPLHKVPFALYSTIVEKMPYSMFKSFNLCSLVALEIITTLPRRVKLEWKADCILIDTNNHWFIDQTEYDEDHEGLDVTNVNAKLHFVVDCITMEDTDMTFFDQHSAKAELFALEQTYLDDGDVEMFQKTLRETGVTKIHIDCRSEQIMYLPELQTIKEIRAAFMYFNDEILLKLRAHTILLDDCDDEPMFHNITPNGIYILLEQWLKKTREIRSFSLLITENLDVEALVKKLQKVYNFEARKCVDEFLLCRDIETHRDCLFIEFSRGRLRMEAETGSYKHFGYKKI